MLELMKFKDYNDLLFKDDETRDLNIGIASCTMNVTNFLKGVGVVSNFTLIRRKTSLIKFEDNRKTLADSANVHLTC